MLVYDQHIAHIDAVVRVGTSRPIDVLKQRTLEESKSAKSDFDTHSDPSFSYHYLSSLSDEESPYSHRDRYSKNFKHTDAASASSIEEADTKSVASAPSSYTSSRAAGLSKSKEAISESDDALASRNMQAQRTFYGLLSRWPRDGANAQAYEDFYTNFKKDVQSRIQHNRRDGSFIYPAQALLYALLTFISEVDYDGRMAAEAIQKFRRDIEGVKPATGTSDPFATVIIQTFGQHSRQHPEVMLGSAGKDAVKDSFISPPVYGT